jgi:hypothetical protein
MSRKPISNLQLLESVLAYPGATDAEIGESLGLSRVQISRRRNSPDFKILMGNHIQASLEPLLLARGKAVRRLCLALDSLDERIALKACELILDRAPAKNKDTVLTGGIKGVTDTLSTMAQGRADYQEKEENLKKFGYQMTNRDLEKLRKDSWK